VVWPVRCPNPGLGNSLDQLGRSNSEGMSQLDDVDEAHIPLTALDAAHVVPVKLNQLRKLLLGEFALRRLMLLIL
jgi:hypothetical protein